LIKRISNNLNETSSENVAEIEHNEIISTQSILFLWNIYK